MKMAKKLASGVMCFAAMIAAGANGFEIDPIPDQ